MSRLLLIFLLAGFFYAGFIQAKAVPPPAPPAPATPPPPVDMNHLPWADGETLTYLVSWMGLDAAQGVFSAHDKGDHWEFDLQLVSRGMVNEVYPFTAYFWSLLAKSPWRSAEYGEYRFEYSRTIKERTRIDYSKHLGTREMWGEGKTKTFPVAEDSVDDIGSMLYHLRAYPWKAGDQRTLYVYESNSEKQGETECQAREKRAFGPWPVQPLLRVMALPTVGTHHRGHLLVWMTDDARHLPIHAELDFRYGTFDIDLVKADKTLPIAH
ncbi:MAG TPA: DUF3108 domain-containing protein [Candidatus Methylacidiphilales bacterium]|nr:DUF3108 domain-containing protein [Candidatus Methylacidiphilales bacterium]